MGRRHAASDVSYPRWIWVAAAATAALLIVGGGFLLRAVIFPGGSAEGGTSAESTPPAGDSLAQDTPGAGAGAAPCISLNILTSLENAEMVRALASEYTAKPRSVDSKCVTPVVTEEKSGVAARKATGPPSGCRTPPRGYKSPGKAAAGALSRRRQPVSPAVLSLWLCRRR
jgi:Ca-activated chloride channel family protein